MGEHDNSVIPTFAHIGNLQYERLRAVPLQEKESQLVPSDKKLMGIGNIGPCDWLGSEASTYLQVMRRKITKLNPISVSVLICSHVA
jgi:hypothetical protein